MKPGTTFDRVEGLHPHLQNAQLCNRSHYASLVTHIRLPKLRSPSRHRSLPSNGLFENEMAYGMRLNISSAVMKERGPSEWSLSSLLTVLSESSESDPEFSPTSSNGF